MAGISLTTFGAPGMIWFSITVFCADCDLTNWQSLVIEGAIFAGGLGSFFYLLQRKNSEKVFENII
jgi:hypothetical protein